MSEEGNQKAKTNVVAAVVAPVIIAALGIGAGLFYQKSQTRVPVYGQIAAFAPTLVTAQIIMIGNGSCYQVNDPSGSGVLSGFPWMHEPQGNPSGDTILWAALDALGQQADLTITFPDQTAGKIGTPFFDKSGKPITKLTIPIGSKTAYGPTGTAGNQTYGDYYFSDVMVGAKHCSNTILNANTGLGLGPMGVHVDK
jgi:hypothetical protein